MTVGQKSGAPDAQTLRAISSSCSGWTVGLLRSTPAYPLS